MEMSLSWEFLGRSAAGDFSGVSAASVGGTKSVSVSVVIKTRVQVTRSSGVLYIAGGVPASSPNIAAILALSRVLVPAAVLVLSFSM